MKKDLSVSLFVRFRTTWACHREGLWVRCLAPLWMQSNGQWRGAAEVEKESWLISLMAPVIAFQYAGQIAGFIKKRCAGKQEQGDGKGSIEILWLVCRTACSESKCVIFGDLVEAAHLIRWGRRGWGRTCRLGLSTEPGRQRLEERGTSTLWGDRIKKDQRDRRSILHLDIHRATALRRNTRLLSCYQCVKQCYQWIPSIIFTALKGTAKKECYSRKIEPWNSVF